MLDAAFLNRRQGNNIGDLACSPGLYFDFGQQAIFDFGDDIPDCKLAILGGGQVFQDCVEASIYATPRARARAVWGVGISEKDAKGWNFDLLQGGCKLISSRNWGTPGCEYVPCPSAMSPLFDAPPAPDHDVVLFTHRHKSGGLPRMPGIPQRDNHDGTMADAIAFLASGETVVTNSYHGTYWAMCLGRRVLCLPFSPKFYGFREPPVMAPPENWPDHIRRAERRPGVLNQARRLNRQFHEKLCNLI